MYTTLKNNGVFRKLRLKGLSGDAEELAGAGGSLGFVPKVARPPKTARTPLRIRNVFLKPTFSRSEVMSRGKTAPPRPEPPNMNEPARERFFRSDFDVDVVKPGIRGVEE